MLLEIISEISNERIFLHFSIFSYNIFPECSGTAIIINKLGNKISFKILLSKKEQKRILKHSINKQMICVQTMNRQYPDKDKWFRMIQGQYRLYCRFRNNPAYLRYQYYVYLRRPFQPVSIAISYLKKNIVIVCGTIF